jgi:hypothetical protein
MKVHGLMKVKANGSATRHAITTPGVKPFEEIRAKANVSWVSELHGQGLKPAKRSRKSYAVNRTGRCLTACRRWFIVSARRNKPVSTPGPLLAVG